jgi:transcriptional regulator GlxA family with amidase domain
MKTIEIDDSVLAPDRFVEANIEEKLSNTEMAFIVNMASNSFPRLFKAEMNITRHNFI